MRRFGVSPAGRRRRATTFIFHAAPHQTRAPIYSSQPRSLRSWHTDITYIPTWQGWVYLATVIDCYTKAVIGYAIDDNYQTPLITAAIKMAARNYELCDGAVFHSDRGSNYTSGQFADTLALLGVAQSVGRTGICYDNALAESFFATLKNELVHRTVYPTREHARKDITQYILFRYNTRRIHSGLDYRTPQEVYDEYSNRQHAGIEA